jgi:hypothetical protein
MAHYRRLWRTRDPIRTGLGGSMLPDGRMVHVWPIIDEDRRSGELIVEALGELTQLTLRASGMVPTRCDWQVVGDPPLLYVCYRLGHPDRGTDVETTASGAQSGRATR